MDVKRKDWARTLSSLWRVSYICKHKRSSTYPGCCRLAIWVYFLWLKNTSPTIYFFLWH